MEQVLKEYLKSFEKLEDDFTSWKYLEDTNDDALSNDWLEKRTSWIYKVEVLAGIDSNKCDWAVVAIGTQRNKDSKIDIIGRLNFNKGENHDIGRVLDRALKVLTYIHPAFDKN